MSRAKSFFQLNIGLPFARDTPSASYVSTFASSQSRDVLASARGVSLTSSHWRGFHLAGLRAAGETQKRNDTITRLQGAYRLYPTTLCSMDGSQDSIHGHLMPLFQIQLQGFAAKLFRTHFSSLAVYLPARQGAEQKLEQCTLQSLRLQSKLVCCSKQSFLQSNYSLLSETTFAASRLDWRAQCVRDSPTVRLQTFEYSADFACPRKFENYLHADGEVLIDERATRINGPNQLLHIIPLYARTTFPAPLQLPLKKRAICWLIPLSYFITPNSLQSAHRVEIYTLQPMQVHNRL